MTKPLVVGLGSHFGDDQAGWLILDQLRELGYPDCDLHKAQHPADILGVIAHSQRLVICDACQGAGRAGTIHCWPWPSEQMLKMQSRGTHDMGLNEVLGVASGLGWRPSTVEIWAVEGEIWFPSTTAGIDVRAAAAETAKAIWRKYSDA